MGFVHTPHREGVLTMTMFGIFASCILIMAMWSPIKFGTWVGEIIKAAKKEIES